MAKKEIKSRRFWIIGLVVLAILGVVAFIGYAGHLYGNRTEVKVTEISAQPKIITTSQELEQYIASHTEGDTLEVLSSDVHYPGEVDWGSQVLVAIKFPLLSAKIVTGSYIDTIDGVESYVVDVRDVPQCEHAYADRIVLIPQASHDVAKPVMLKTTYKAKNCYSKR